MSHSSKKSPRSRTASAAAPADPLAGAAGWLALAAPVASAPSPAVRQALLARIRGTRAGTATSAPAGWKFSSASSPEGWRGGAVPGVRFKTLSVDAARDVVMLLIEMAPGAKFPDHTHDLGGDEGIVLSGDVMTGGRLLRAGDYYCAAEGTVHADAVSPGGCTALISLTNRAWLKWREQLAVR